MKIENINNRIAIHTAVNAAREQQPDATEKEIKGLAQKAFPQNADQQRRFLNTWKNPNTKENCIQTKILADHYLDELGENFEISDKEIAKKAEELMPKIPSAQKKFVENFKKGCRAAEAAAEAAVFDGDFDEAEVFIDTHGFSQGCFNHGSMALLMRAIKGGEVIFEKTFGHLCRSKNRRSNQAEAATVALWHLRKTPNKKIKIFWKNDLEKYPGTSKWEANLNIFMDYYGFSDVNFYTTLGFFDGWDELEKPHPESDLSWKSYWNNQNYACVFAVPVGKLYAKMAEWSEIGIMMKDLKIGSDIPWHPTFNGGEAVGQPDFSEGSYQSRPIA